MPCSISTDAVDPVLVCHMEPWTAVRFENVGIVVHGGVAMAMGSYFFCRADGSEVGVNYSFVY